MPLIPKKDVEEFEKYLIDIAILPTSISFGKYERLYQAWKNGEKVVK